jgi:hypothetical protein
MNPFSPSFSLDLTGNEETWRLLMFGVGKCGFRLVQIFYIQKKIPTLSPYYTKAEKDAG